MKKFKIKNRQKRKYVKKRDLASSLSSVQSLTVGLVPLVLLAIAFFTTVLMYNPPIKSLPFAPNALSMPPLPNVELPRVHFTFTLPTLPSVSMPALPKVSMPEMPKVALPSIPSTPKFSLPKIILPNLGASLLSVLSGIAHTLISSVLTIMKIADIVEIQLTSFAWRTVSFIDPRPLFASTGNGIVSLTQNAMYGISRGINHFQSYSLKAVTQFVTGTITATQNSIHSLQHTVRVLLQFANQGLQVLLSWFQNMFNAIVKAVSDFIWFLGTPFRAVGQSIASLNKSMEPFYNWMGRSFENTKNELSIGGNNLLQGSAFVGSSIEKNYGKK